MSITLLILGPNLKPVTDPVVGWTSIECDLKFCAVGAGEFLAPVTPKLMDAVTTPGNRVSIIRDNAVFHSGPIEKPGSLDWKADAGGRGTVRVNWATHEALLTHKLTYPNPGLASTAQTAIAWAATAVNAETVLRDLVNLNAGPGALVERRITGLTLGDVAGAGTPVTITTRFEVLTDVLRTVAAAGGGLGWRISQVGTGLVFEVYAPADRSKSVRFSRSVGNLRELTTDPSAPTATVALVGGDGEGVSRQIIERAAAPEVLAEWGRIETWVSQSGTDAPLAELQQAGDKALADGAEKVGLTATAVDGSKTRYGVDYWLGDRVAIESVPGIAITDVVSAVKLTATPGGGETITPTIGEDTRTEPAEVRLIRELERRIARLERG